MTTSSPAKVRLGLLIDIDLCIGCGACVIACAVENNVPAVTGTDCDRKGITPMRVYSMGRDVGGAREDRAFVPVPCQHCDNNPPCVSVCPQNAVQVDSRTGVVGQIPQRCMGCRYCMAACPYHARYFNWWDPQWPKGQEEMLNPDVAPRTRGVAEKCNLCHGRLHIAREQSATLGKDELIPDGFVPACEEACPTLAIIHGNMDDPKGRIALEIAKGRAFRMLENLGTSTKVIYASDRDWVRQSLSSGMPPATAKGTP